MRRVARVCGEDVHHPKPDRDWSVWLCVGLSAAIHAGLAIYLFYAFDQSLGTVKVPTTAISVNLESSDVLEAAESSAATEAAPAPSVAQSRPPSPETFRPAPEPERMPERKPEDQPNVRANAAAQLEKLMPDAQSNPTPQDLPPKLPTDSDAEPSKAETRDEIDRKAAAREPDAFDQKDSGAAFARKQEAESKQAQATEQLENERQASAEIAEERRVKDAEGLRVAEETSRLVTEAARPREAEELRSTQEKRVGDELTQKAAAARRQRALEARVRLATLAEQAAVQRQQQSRVQAMQQRQAAIAAAKSAERLRQIKAAPQQANAGASGSRAAQSSQARVSASTGSIQNYGASVRARIAANKPRGRPGGGTVIISLAIAPSGSLAGASIARSSGDSSLDQAALSAVRSASPFPPPPGGSSPRFSVPFYFR